MERRINVSDIRQAVQQAYEKALPINDGNVDPRMKDVNTDKFGISVALTDGTIIEIGDTDVKAPLGGIAKVPVILTLMQQLDDPVEAVERAGAGCGCNKDKVRRPHISVSAYGVRAMSAVEPNGDSDGKWAVLMDGIVTAMGSSPTLNDDLYRRMTKTNIDTNAEDTLADARFYLYDNAASSIDLYTRLTAMEATTSQLAAYGATIAADGFNPQTRSEVFESSLAHRLVASMAVRGPHHASHLWLVCTGLPARSSFGGTIMGVLPGVLAISAYSPRVNETGISVRAAAAISYFMNGMQFSALSSSSIVIEK